MSGPYGDGPYDPAPGGGRPLSMPVVIATTRDMQLAQQNINAAAALSRQRDAEGQVHTMDLESAQQLQWARQQQEADATMSQTIQARRRADREEAEEDARQRARERVEDLRDAGAQAQIARLDARSLSRRRRHEEREERRQKRQRERERQDNERDMAELMQERQLRDARWQDALARAQEQKWEAEQLATTRRRTHEIDEAWHRQYLATITGTYEAHGGRGGADHEARRDKKKKKKEVKVLSRSKGSRARRGLSWFAT